MPKSFSEVRDDEGYQPLRPKCRMRSSAVPSRNAQSPLEQIVRSEAKIRKGRRFFGLRKKKNKILQNYQRPMAYYSFIAECTVSSGADCSDRSEDKKGEKNFEITKKIRITDKLNFTTTDRVLLLVYREMHSLLRSRSFGAKRR